MTLPVDLSAAAAITLPDDPGAERPSPAPLLRRSFVLGGPVRRAQLVVTALGLHHLTINGRPVSDELLAPGWTPYGKRLLSDAYDVAELLVSGENVIGAALGDGWYRGRIGWNPGRDRRHYGREVALIARLDLELADGRREAITTDASWLASTGEIRSADLYDGAVVDLRLQQVGWDRPGFDATAWVPVREVPFDSTVIEPRMAPPVRRVAELPVTRTPAGRGRVGLDSGQNLAGFVRLTVRGAAGDRVAVRHAEVLEPDGSLHTRSLRSAQATDVYVLADDRPTVLEPPFTFHGFRYAEVETDAEVLDATVVAISSDKPRRGWFESSDAALNRLHENVVWSQGDNFVSVPTDCPQRDERLGLDRGRPGVRPDGRDTVRRHRRSGGAGCGTWHSNRTTSWAFRASSRTSCSSGEMRYGRAGWADAATMVPWAVYESFGDPADPRRAVRQHVPLGGVARAAPGPPTGWSGPATSSVIGSTRTRHPIGRGRRRPMPSISRTRTSPTALALLAEAAPLAGRPALAARYRALADELARRRGRAGATMPSRTRPAARWHCGSGSPRRSERVRVAGALAELVRAADGRVATGFLGTPLVLPALADAGSLRRGVPDAAPARLAVVALPGRAGWNDGLGALGRDPAGRVDPPGSMAPNPIDPNGREGQMLSFNHYAYGAVIDWVYRHLAGIAPDRANPGYRHVIFAPKPCAGIEWAKASIETPPGTVAIDWRLQDGTLVADLRLPPGSSGTFVAPCAAGSTICLDGAVVSSRVTVPAGDHRVSVTRPVIADPRRALG